MKKKTSQKLRIEKIRIANLRSTNQQTTKGKLATWQVSRCLCEPTDFC